MNKISLLLLFNLILAYKSCAQQNNNYFDYICFHEGYAIVSCNSDLGINSGSKHGIIDSTFKLIVPEIYDNFLGDDFGPIFRNNKIVGRIGEKYFIINSKGEVEKSNLSKDKAFEYYNKLVKRNKILTLINGFEVHHDTNYYKTVFNKQGKVMFRGRYYSIYDGIGNQFITTIIDSNNYIKNEVLLDSTGNLVTKFKTEDIKLSNSKDFYWIKDSLTFKCYDTSFKLINNFYCDDVYPNETHNTSWVKLNDKWGLINSKFKFVITPQFESVNIYLNRDSLSRVELNKKGAYIRNDGKQITDFVYNMGYWSQFSGNYISVERDDLSQILDKNFKCLFNCDSTFDVEKYDNKKHLLVKGKIVNYKKEGEWLYYLNGKILSKYFYVNGLEEGKAEFFNKNGDLIEVCYYKNGVSLRRVSIKKVRKSLFQFEYIEQAQTHGVFEF